MTKKILLAITYTLLGSVLGIIILYIYMMQNRPELFPWHKIHLQQEFTTKQLSKINSFSKYLLLENRLFDELQDKIYRKKTTRQQFQLIRYDSGSLADPTAYDTNWNRSFELKQDNAKAGVLLLHGLSDSPYSLRKIADTLHKQGYYVLGLRMPGHGTIPSGLVDASWQDMAAAVKLAAIHLSKQIGRASKFHIIGYSMGAAQAVNYSLDALQDTSLPRAKSLVLISPAIGVSSAAALAIWQSRLSAIPGLEKLAWNSIGPEYDPYKYTSFAVTAGDQMYRLTIAVGDKLNSLKDQNILPEFPPTLAFMSVVDATVSVSAVVHSLLLKLRNDGNELVLFDINRNNNVIPFLKQDPEEGLRKLLNDSNLNFRVSLLSNVSTDSLVIHESNKELNNTRNRRKLDLSWPRNIYSLSHVALPFSGNDSLYGNRPDKKEGLHIGLMAARGERGILSIPASDMLRLRYNPFYTYLEQRTVNFLSQ
ncbi:MAG: alpha/beta fold hydrolase [Gammaproteobacteria bacterium]|nr:MAG: alpha/beta fold hydrolase [Gammaproteobacteria bacterium]